MVEKMDWSNGQLVNASDLNSVAAAVNANTSAITALQTAGGATSVDGIPVVTVTTTGGAPIVSKVDYLTGTIQVGGGAAATTSIRGRGNTTWVQPKKPYRIKLDTAASLLGMPSSKNWALLANYLDISMIRNSIAYHIGQLCSGLAWTPKYRPVDLVLNGVYQGSYLLTEIVKAEASRVNVTVSNAGTGLASTGAYLLEIDNYYRDAVHQFTTTHDSLNVMLDDPDGTNATYGAAQVTYITNWINNFETVLYGGSWLDPTTGYAPLIDQSSFVDWYLVNELLASDDGNFTSSCKCYKTRDATGVPGKLFMGPLWDYDLALGRTWMGMTYSATGWWVRGTTAPSGDTDGPGATWINRMMSDPNFADALVARWPQIVTAIGDIGGFVDTTAQTLALAYGRDADVWNDTGREAAPWRIEAEYLKTWISDRITWITDNLVDSLDAVSDVTPPSVPTGLASSAITSNSFDLSWSASTGSPTGYEVRLDGGTAVADSASPHTFTGLTASTGYDAQVRAKDASLNWSAWSSILTVTTSSGGVSVPSPVSNFDFHEGSGSSTTSLVGGYTMAGSSWHSGGGIDGQFFGHPGASGSLDNWTIMFDCKILTAPGAATGLGHLGSDPWFNLNPSLQPGPWSPNQFGSVAIPLNTRSKVVYVFTSTDCSVYVDGTLSGTFSNTHPADPGGEDLVVLDSAAHADAVVYQVKFWDSALTGAQIAAL